MKRNAEHCSKSITPADVRAIQDIEQGIATEEQQKRGLGFIINNLCGTYQPTFGGSDRESSFLDGRRFVGLELVNCLNLNAAKIAELQKRPEEK